MSLGKMLRERRRSLDLTLKDVAERVGVSVPFLADLERDLRSTSRYRELASALGFEEAELITANARVTRDLKQWLEGHPDVLRLVTEIRAGSPEDTLRKTAEKLFSSAHRKQRRTPTPALPEPETGATPAPMTNVERMQQVLRNPKVAMSIRERQ